MTGIGLVISDMVTNMSGVDVDDRARAMHLMGVGVGFFCVAFATKRCFLVKSCQGACFEDFYTLMRGRFARVVTRKPKASRDRSSELYLLGTKKLKPEIL